jgi:hypothetical protein
VGTARALIVLGAGAPIEDDVDRATAKFQKSLNISQDLEDAEGIVLSLLYTGIRGAHAGRRSTRIGCWTKEACAKEWQEGRMMTLEHAPIKAMSNGS